MGFNTGFQSQINSLKIQNLRHLNVLKNDIKQIEKVYTLNVCNECDVFTIMYIEIGGRLNDDVFKV